MGFPASLSASSRSWLGRSTARAGPTYAAAKSAFRRVSAVPAQRVIAAGTAHSRAYPRAGRRSDVSGSARKFPERLGSFRIGSEVSETAHSRAYAYHASVESAALNGTDYQVPVALAGLSVPSDGMPLYSWQHYQYPLKVRIFTVSSIISTL